MAKVGRPSMGERVSTAVRLPVGLHARLEGAADERDVSVNYLVVRAVERYLDSLPPLTTLDGVSEGEHKMMVGRFPKRVGGDVVDLAEAVDADQAGDEAGRSHPTPGEKTP